MNCFAKTITQTGANQSLPGAWNVCRVLRGLLSVVALLFPFVLHNTAIAEDAQPAPSQSAEKKPGTAEPKAEFTPEQIAFFEKQVRPLLIEHCQKCHGEKKQQGNLRLDSRAAVLRGGDSGAAVQLADWESSLLLEAVSYAPDAVVEMPPESRLDQAQRAVLIRWVKEGLPWPGSVPNPTKPDPVGSDSNGTDFSEEQREFWAFQPVRPPEHPQVKNSSWVQNPIDVFVLAELEKRGLAPAQPADKRTLIRRAMWNLTGLPPSPEEIDDFVADDSPTAFADLVDRFLASPHYGERWSRHWLDVVRYADSNGMDENLAHANAYHYRDYVIRAFNDDKPYDQFVREQLAGDLMGDPNDEETTLERMIATGFLAIGPKMLAEDDPVKMEMDIIDEQIDTLGKCFMGMSLGCARCHDHKFDPVTTADYYALAGIFKSTKTMNNYSVVAQWYERPVEPESVVAAFREHELQVSTRKKSIAELTTGANEEFLKAARSRVADYLLAASERLELQDVLMKFAARLDAGEPLNVEGAVSQPAEKFARGNVDLLVQSTDPAVTIIGTYKRGESFAEYDIAAKTSGPHALLIRYAAAASRPLRLSVNGSLVKADAVGKTTGRWDHTGQRWFFETVVELEHGNNTLRLECSTLFPHVNQLLLVPVAGIATKPGTLGLPDTTAVQTGLSLSVVEQWVTYLVKTRDDPKSVLAAWHQLNSNLDGSFASLTGSSSIVKALAAAAKRAARQELLRGYRETFRQAEVAWDTLQSVAAAKEQKQLPDPELEAFRQLLYDLEGPFKIPGNVEKDYAPTVRDQLAENRAALQSLEKLAPPPLRYAMGVTEKEVCNAKICIRGNHVNLGPEVPRRFLEIIDGPEQTPLDKTTSGRLELAHWLTRPDHPLTSRTIVNRVWHWHFGAGLVRTTDNLGLMGEKPTHPELLDWLTDQFVRSGWSLKQLHRLIMSSATYQMCTDYNAAAAESDPENRFLWRMNRRRLEAEAIRDGVLKAAGTLDRTAGGTLLRIKNRAYVTSTASNLTVEFNNARRSVYQPVIRSALYELFQAFDFPDPSALQGNRSTTTVAPQALFMLNSRFLDDQTAAMAKRLMAECPVKEAERIDRAYALAFGRSATPEELAEAEGFLKIYREQIGAETTNADEVDLQSWRGLCRVLLASSEFLYVE
jgi:hypothetical protein